MECSHLDNAQQEFDFENEFVLRKSMTEKVQEFLDKFNLKGPLEPEKMALRLQHSMEEHIELSEAVEKNDRVQIIDALMDQVYIAIGTALLAGYDPEAHFDAIHRANMRKERGINPKRPDSDGFDVIKPPGWYGPDEEHIELIDGVRRVIQ